MLGLYGWECSVNIRKKHWVVVYIDHRRYWLLFTLHILKWFIIIVPSPEKIAEAQRKFTTLKNEAECGGYLSAKSSLNQIRRNAIGGQVLDSNVKKLLAKTHRKAKNLKLAFSEFYLSLVLLQNFQVRFKCIWLNHSLCLAKANWPFCIF
jgi:hypothetical protein